MQKNSFENRIFSAFLGLAVVPLFIFLVISGSNIFIPHEDFDELRSKCWEEYESERFIEHPVDRDREVTPVEPESEKDYQKRKECNDRVRSLEEDFRVKQFAVGLVAGIIGLGFGTFLAVKSFWFIGAGFNLGALGSIVFAITVGGSVIGQGAAFVGVLIVLVALIVISLMYANNTKKKQ